MHNVTLIKGDGIGPSIMEAAVKIIDASGAKINWEEADAGMAAFDKHGTLAAGASLFPRFASNHRVASFWSNLGEYKERKRLKADFDEVQAKVYQWVDSWIYKGK